jgi:hypothetical protein
VKDDAEAEKVANIDGCQRAAWVLSVVYVDGRQVVTADTPQVPGALPVLKRAARETFVVVPLFGFAVSDPSDMTADVNERAVARRADQLGRELVRGRGRESSVRT